MDGAIAYSMSMNVADLDKGGTMERMACNTCTREYGSPFRVYDELGRVILGCIDACHAGHLVTPSESARWHNRPEAKKWRAGVKRLAIRSNHD